MKEMEYKKEVNEEEYVKLLRKVFTCHTGLRHPGYLCLREQGHKENHVFVTKEDYINKELSRTISHGLRSPSLVSVDERTDRAVFEDERVQVRSQHIIQKYGLKPSMYVFDKCPTQTKSIFMTINSAFSSLVFMSSRYNKNPRVYLCSCSRYHISTKQNFR